ncbi:MAG: hypothetical protein K6W08_15660 [Firmicutes bacterium]|nr:hypothetical protein [Bacillota bacterium]
MRRAARGVQHLPAAGGGLGTSAFSDPDGNRTSQADPSGTTTLACDALDRFTSAAYPGG